MCGIVGMIGQPKDDVAAGLSHQLFTELMKSTVVRGSHATGVYSLMPSESEGKNRVFIYKLDAPSTQFVTTKKWKSLSDSKVFLHLGHCRFATHGDFKDHINNHPHFTEDRKLALIHNGVISGYETLKRKFPVKGSCDSEVLLRIIESESTVMEGIKKMYDEVPGGSYACMASEYDKASETAHLHCFRNDRNPLVVIDFREEWGQLFFASTKEIAEKSMKSAALPAELRAKVIADVPAYEVWSINHKTLEIVKVEVEAPVVSYGYGNGTSYYGSAGYNRGGYSVDTAAQTTLPATTSRVLPVRSPSILDPKRRKIRELLDTILENLVTLDLESEAPTTEDERLDEIYSGLEEFAWNMETVANPDVDDLGSSDDQGGVDLLDRRVWE